MMRIVYFIKNVLWGVTIALLMSLALYIAVAFVWGLPVIICGGLGLLFLVWCWDKACDEYEEKHGNKEYNHPKSKYDYDEGEF